MDSGDDNVGSCFPERKESRQGARCIVKTVFLATESRGSESRQAGTSAGAVSALAGSREVLLLSAQRESWQMTAAASESTLQRGLTVTAAISGRVVGAGDVVASAGHMDHGGFYTQRVERGTVVDSGKRGEEVPMPAGAGLAGRDNPKLFVGTTEG